jgi:hypothetical protein
LIRRYRRRRRGRADGTVASNAPRPAATGAQAASTRSAARPTVGATEIVRLVIAFAAGKLRPEVRAVGEQVGAEFADVGASDTAYSELVAKLWAAGESFLLLEHDVLPTPELLDEMWACESAWCAGFAWRYSGPVYPGETKPQYPIRQRETALFLSKFAADLLRRTPNVIGGVRVRWPMLDLALLPTLRQSGAEPHLHGPVTHLHQQHPAWAAAMTESDWADA